MPELLATSCDNILKKGGGYEKLGGGDREEMLEKVIPNSTTYYFYNLALLPFKWWWSHFYLILFEPLHVTGSDVADLRLSKRSLCRVLQVKTSDHCTQCFLSENGGVGLDVWMYDVYGELSLIR